MRIAYILDQVLPCTETDTEQALNTVTAFARQGAQVRLVLARPLHESAADAEALRRYYQVEGDFELVRLRSLFPTHRAVEKPAHALRAMLHRGLKDVDLLYTRNVPTMLAAAALGRPLVYETYRAWPRQYPALGPLFRRALTAPSVLGAVFHSEFARQSYVNLGVPAERSIVAHNGFDPRRFTTRPSPTEARRALGMPEGKPLVLYAGRMTMAKGMGIVFELARAMPELNFALVGSEKPGEVEARAAELGNVFVYPWQNYDTLPRYLFAADVLMLPPSLGPLEKVGNTVLPMKLFLYLAAGRPIFAPRAPDTEELLHHGENAWLVVPDDAKAAQAALASLMGQPELVARLGEGALASSQGLTWDARAKRILEFIEERRGVGPSRAERS